MNCYEGKWELFGGGSYVSGASVSLRKYLEASSDPTPLIVTNFNHAWRTDGSELGRATTYMLGAVPGVFSGALVGSLESGGLRYAVPGIPAFASGRYYPRPLTRGDGGWRYAPFDMGLPKTISLPSSMNAGYPSDVELTVTVSSTTGSGTRLCATATGLEFDERWNTLYLEEAFGDGYARAGRRLIGSGGARRWVDTIGWDSRYHAWWRTAYTRSGSPQVAGIGGLRVDTTVGVGVWRLSELLAAGLALTLPGYLHTSPNSTPRYRVD